MFTGHFDVQKMMACGLTDADFTRAIKEGRIKELLKKLPVVQRCSGSNRIFDNMAGYILHRKLSLPACAGPFYRTENNPPAALTWILLANTDGDTTSYTEDSDNWDGWGYNRNMNTGVNSVNTSSAAKRFEEDQIYGWTIGKDLDSNGRESIYFRNAFLYLPTEGYTSGGYDIRSIGIYYASDGDSAPALDYYTSTALIGRVRLKDSAGNKIAVTKNTSEVLFVEYTFQLVSM